MHARDRAITAALAAIALVWAGMVLGVPFLATAAKFLAPSLSLPVALDVGRHTFEVFIAVEIGLASVLIALLILRAQRRALYLLAAIPCLIVAVDFLWLRPVLDARVEIILQGGHPAPSHLHTVYIVLECIKLAALLALGGYAMSNLVQPPGKS